MRSPTPATWVGKEHGLGRESDLGSDPNPEMYLLSNTELVT